MSSKIQYQKKGVSKKELIRLYDNLIKPRMIEEKMLILLRQGKISKWFSGIGQEAISVGCTLALQVNEFILPMHRNLGVFTSRDIPLSKLFAQFQGKKSGFTKGRDRSFHFGSIEHHIIGMISHLGPQLSLADGIALDSNINSKNKATLVFTGDGGTSQGEFHEALNVAAVWDLPVLFVIENNGYGLSTPTHEQYRCKQFVDKGIGYGIEAIKVDGNNILDVYSTIKKMASSIREKPRPILIECMTFRMRGHEEASGTKYVPKQLFEKWAKKDPVKNFEDFLIQNEVIDLSYIESKREQIKKEIENGLDFAFSESAPLVDSHQEYSDIYFEYNQVIRSPKSAVSQEKRLVDAISDGLKLAMKEHKDLIIMGQDIAEYGGVFKITEGFVEEFGKHRVRNTPLCESAIIGTALGLSIAGAKSVVEMQFADFVTCGFNQIINNLAKIHYRWGQKADVVIRMPTGAGVAAGPFHSQSNEAWFTHTPGLKVIYPAFPDEAKGLLLAAIEDPNPILFFEHKALYRSIRSQVPEDYYTIEIGKAALVSKGDDITLITYGQGVHWALEVLEEQTQISADVLNLRTLLPLDEESIYTSVRKTGKVLVLHEDCLTGGIGAEIAALISENCFESLDAPVVRVASLDTPVPFHADLEANFLPKDRFKIKLLELFNY